MQPENVSERALRINTRNPWSFAVTVVGVVCCFSNTAVAQSCVPTPSGLVSWWRAEGNGADAAGGSHGTLAGGVGFAAGRVGQAFSFNGAGEVSVPSTAALNVQSFTFETWVNPSIVDHDIDIILNKENNPLFSVADISYEIGIRGTVNAGSGSIPAGHLAFFLGGITGLPDEYGGGWVGGGAEVPMNSWTHCALTFDGAEVRVYINGSLTRNISGLSGTVTSTTGPFKIGSRATSVINIGPTYRFNGLIDEVSVYNRALAATEVQAIFAAGATGKCVPIPAAMILTGPVTNAVNGHAYYLLAETNWSAAEAIAVGLGGHLATLNDAAENLWVFTNFATFGGGDRTLWTGLNDQETEGVWRWISGDAAPYRNWAPGEPNSGGGYYPDEDHVVMWNPSAGYPAGSWSDAPSNLLFAAVVEIGDATSPATVILTGPVTNTVNGHAYYLLAETNWPAAEAIAVSLGGHLVTINDANENIWVFTNFSTFAGGDRKLWIGLADQETEGVWRWISGDPSTYRNWASGEPNSGGGYFPDEDHVLMQNPSSGFAPGSWNDAPSNQVFAAVVEVGADVPPVTNCITTPQGLVSWWRGESDAVDAVGGNNGTLQSGLTVNTGEVGQAFSFNGSDQYISVPASASLNVGLGGGFTIECWIKPSDISGPRPLAEWNDGSGIVHGTHFWISEYASGGGQGSLYANLIDASGGHHKIFSTGGFVGTNGFSHVALTYDHATGVATLYCNGLIAAAQNLGVFTPQTSYPLFLGKRTSGVGAGIVYSGLMDEVSLYNRALSAIEIQSIHQAGGFGKCDVPIQPSITQQPANKAVTAGANATFTAGAAGSSPLSYQWLYNTNVIAEATNASLVLSNVQISQAGAYSVVVTNSAGSISSSNAILSVNYPTAVARVLGSNVGSGSTFSVPVQLVANGNENGIGFTLNFSTSLVSYVEITLGSGATGGSLFVNSNQSVNGHLGVLLALPTDTTFAAGTQEVVRISFTASVFTNATSTLLSFGDSPIVRQLSDAPGNALPVSFANGTVNIASAEYEGDVSPRPNGSMTVTLTDWVLVGRYAALLDAPTNSSEFQRADCAPRSSLGNGSLTVSDWVQAGRYAASLDPLTVAGGPTSGSGLVLSSLKSSGGGGPANLTGREVVASSSSLLQGDSTTVKVNLVSQGDENALQFSLGFDPAALSYTGATLGSSSSGATLNVNTNSIGSGRVGLVLALPSGNHYVAGTQETVKVNFKSVATAAGSFAVNLIDLPLVREVSDPTANVLEANYVNGNVVLNPPPSLRIAPSGPNVTLAWPSWAVNFGLQVSDNAAPLSASWTNLVATPSVIGNENVVSQPLGGATKFYRLFRP